MKLFLVRLRGMQSNMSGPAYGQAYVVADNTDAAYQMVRGNLDKQDVGFPHERELQSVELLAEQGEYPQCRHMLYLPKK